MKILQINNRIPYPLNDGGNIGVFYYTQGYIDAGVELSLLAMNTIRHWVDTEQLPDIFNQLKRFKTVKIDNRITVYGALKSLIKGSSYNIDRFISKEFEQALIQMLQEDTYDIVQLESLFVTPYLKTIRKYSKAKIAIRQHNVEFKIWERLAQQEKSLLKKSYLKYLAAKMKAYELKHINDYDVVLPISTIDKNLLLQLGCTVPMFLHPFGIDVTYFSCIPSNLQPVTLYHIGAMDWLPNQESVDWLLEKVMPLLFQKLPHVKLYLAGRNMPEPYLQLQFPNVVVVGEVADAKAFETDKTILLVPLQSGGGVRIKIFQGMAMGKCIITTDMGVEGIDATNNVHLYIANTPEAFVEKIEYLTQNTDKIHAVGQAARQLIEEKYNRQRLIHQLLQFYDSIIST